MTETSSAALRVDGLRISYGNRSGDAFRVIDGLALDLAAGESLLVTGPSGSGKSSLIYALTGLLRPEAGAVHWNGTDIWTLGERRRDAWRLRNLGIVFQDFHLIPELSPVANVLFPATFTHWRTPAALRRAAARLLDEVGVPAHRRTVSVLSRGEQQRVAVARALLFDPPVLIADEPTASLDAGTGDSIASLLIDVAARGGKTLVVVSHDAVFGDRLSGHLALERDAVFRMDRNAAKRKAS